MTSTTLQRPLRNWLLVIGTWLCALVSPQVQALAVGEEAPEITVIKADGKPVRLSELRGKTVYLDFWASWCGPCRQSFPFMNAMQDKYAGAGLVIVGINVDKKRADADRFLAQFPSRFTIAYDEQGVTPAAYAVKKMPSSMLIDTKGRIVSAHSGFDNAIRDDVEARIRASLPSGP